MSARYRSTCIINEKHLLDKGGNLDDYLPQLLMVNGVYLLVFDKMSINCQNPVNKCIGYCKNGGTCQLGIDLHVL